MADSKITALTSISTSTDPANDPLVIVDVSDTSMAASGTTKKVTLNNLLACSPTATLASATITGDLTVRTSKLAVTSTNVGIGTASPTLAAGVGLEIENAGIATLRLQNTSGANAFELQVDSDANGVLYRGYNNSPHVFYVNNSTAMTLNSTGLGVGASPANGKLIVGADATTDGNGFWNTTLRNTVAAATTAPKTGLSFSGYWNGTSNFANFAGISGGKENTTDANTAGMLTMWTSPNGGSPTTRLTIDSSGNVGIGVTPAGTGGCLQLKSGITFPATQVASSDANTLDDYEEGTWTPTIIGTTTAGTGTYSTQRGDYIKIGRLVTVQFYVAWTAHTGTGNMNVSGLPFTTQNIGTYFAAAAMGFVDLISMTAGNIMTGYAGPNSTTLLLKQTPTGGGASADIPIDTSGSIIVSLTYIANA